MKDWAEKLNGARAVAFARALRSLSNLVKVLEGRPSQLQILLALEEAKATLDSKLEEYFDAPGSINTAKIKDGSVYGPDFSFLGIQAGGLTPDVALKRSHSPDPRLLNGGTIKNCFHVVNNAREFNHLCIKCGVDLRQNTKTENMPFPDYVADQLYNLVECDSLPGLVTDNPQHIGLYFRSPGYKTTPVVAVSTNGRKIDLKTIKHGTDVLDQCGRKVATIQFGILNFDSTRLGNKRLGYFVRVQDMKTGGAQ